MRALTGRPPFVGGSSSVLTRKRVELPTPLIDLNPEAPSDLAELCMQLIQRDPEYRPISAVILGVLGVDTPGRMVEAPFVGRTAEFEVLRAIDEREDAGQVMEDTLVVINQADLVEAYMESSMATVTVKFVSEQVNVVRDAEGQIASGNPNEVAGVTDFWTFARDVHSSDPNWGLVATRSLD